MATQESIIINVETRDAINNVAQLGAAITAVFAGAVAAVASFADEIVDTADAFGIATSEVLALSMALDATGGKGENAAKLLQGVANSISDLNNGNIKTLQSFEQLGMTLTELGQMSESEIRNKMIVQLGEMSNKTEAAALAVKVFGKAAMGVDFAKLADEIKSNSSESEKYAGAIKDAADAYDNMHHIIKQLKLAFAEAFNPVFKMLADIHVTTQDIVDTFKTMVQVIVPIVVGITAVRTAILLANGAMVLFNATTKLNPWVAGASAIVAGLTAVGMYISNNTDEQEQNTKETEKTGTATKANVVNTSELNNKLKQQRDEIIKIGQEYKNNTGILNTQYSLMISSQTQSAVQYQQAKSLNDLQIKFTNDLRQEKEKFSKLDADMQGRQQQAYLDTIKTINDQYDIQRNITSNRIYDEQLIKSQLDSQMAIANISVSLKSDLLKMRSDSEALTMTTKERLEYDYAVKSQLETIAILQREINGSAFLTTEEKKKYLEAVSQIKTIEEGITLATELQSKTHTNIAYQILQQNAALAKQSEVATEISDKSRSFNTGWKTAFNEYANNASNAANRARDIFNSMTNNMNSALDNFVETGKLNFNDLANSIIKDIIKIELKSAAANLLTASKGISWGSMLGFAEGGTPPVGRASIVGENGPELFVPKSSGTIIPNNQLGGGGGVVNNHYYTVNAVDAKSVAQLFAENRKTLYGSVKMAEKETSYRMR